MQANAFAIIENKNKLSHSYLCWGDFVKHENDFEDSLLKIGVRLNSPGHFIYKDDTFGVDNARDLVSWYQRNQTSNDDSHTIAVIAAGIIKKDAQQMLLKILEEAVHPYIFFIFARPGTEIIETVISRSQIINLPYLIDKDIEKLLKLDIGDRIKKVTNDIKGLESSEIRDYTESLVRGLIFHFTKENEPIYREKSKLLLKIQKTLNDSYIAPKFILDYIITVI